MELNHSRVKRWLASIHLSWSQLVVLSFRNEHTDPGYVTFRWCGPCKILGPRLEKAVAKQKGRVAMAKVDIDDHTDLAIEYGVRPT